jgi:UDP-N-acetyl-2-amino-2-deoxyglucuronate dehydrogenase
MNASDTATARGARRRGFGIVGAGVIGEVHAEAIGLVPGARLAAVTDEAPGRAKALAEAWGGTAEPDLEALLARDDVDVVCVCVPSGLHAEVGVQAAAAGKHLVVEKPIDVTLEAADRLIAAAQANNVLVTVISQHRFDTGLDELRRLLAGGELGSLLLGEASTKWYRTQDYYDSAAWRGTWELDGGSLMNQGIHYLDLLLWAMGPAAEVTAICATQAHHVEVEDTTLALVRFASGAVGTVLSSTAAYPGFDQRLEITGTNGTVIIENGAIARRALASDRDTAAPAAPDTPDAPATEPTAAANPAGIDPSSHAAQMADFLAAIDDGREPAVTAESARATLQVICAVYESARTGRRVALPSPGEVGA